MGLTRFPRRIVQLIQAASLIWLVWVLIAPPLRNPRPFGASAPTDNPLNGPSLRLPRRARFSIVVDPPRPSREAAIRGGDPEEAIEPRALWVAFASFAPPMLVRSARSARVDFRPIACLRC